MQSCGKGNTQNADYFIRKHLCKTCRAQDWVKLSQIKRKHPELHPHVDQICLCTNRELLLLVFRSQKRWCQS